MDEAGLSLGLEPTTQQEALEHLALLIGRCHEGGHVVERAPDLFEIPVAPGVALFQVLFETERAIDEDVRRLARLALDRCTAWIPGPGSEDGIVDVSGEIVVSAAIGHAHDLAGRKEAACLLQAVPLRRGRRMVLIQSVGRHLHFAWENIDVLGFLRDVPEVEEMDGAEYLAHASHAFPDIAFTDGLASQLRRFSRPFEDIRVEITRHLSVLNDNFRTIFLDCKGDPSRVIAALAARGVLASPESPNTKKNAAAWSQRRIEFDGRELYCDWHAKLEPHRDRIHFHPGKADVAGGRLIVGIFHAHLAT